ncbi:MULTISPECIES: HU family DNA-binding protein [Bacteroides]|uniref:HU family DNA-binding protein n=1 Tax=Bacteroides TaxID=816 RepID=UPI000E70DAF7|nr:MULTISPECIES: HU family DNA-binding protein [unclassified Bacteroides]RJV26680.1 DNA-binding protein [Bacteroides sp. AF25-17LB]RJV26719.1 DNA-binding protein [Bacteroides sp. AF25-5LB]
MINYSVFLLPNPQNKEAAPKAFAKAQVSEVMSFRGFVQHIADHGGHKRGTVKGVLSDMCECLVEMLLEGKKVQLDELGDFWLSLTSTGAENCQKFTAANIKGVNILFTPGADFENLIDRAEFNPVASRVAQVATLKAEKSGIGLVDIDTAKGKKPTDGGSDDSGNTGDNDEMLQ